MKRFFIQSTTLTFIVLILGVVVYTTFLKPFYHILLPFTLIFFYVATNLVHCYLLKIAVNSGARFSSKYMAINFIKMFSYLLIAIAVALIIAFLAWFFSNILIYILVSAVLSVIGKPIKNKLLKIKFGKLSIPNSIASAIALIIILTVFFSLFFLSDFVDLILRGNQNSNCTFLYYILDFITGKVLCIK